MPFPGLAKSRLVPLGMVCLQTTCAALSDFPRDFRIGDLINEPRGLSSCSNQFRYRP
jgi:hypothetical protein